MHRFEERPEKAEGLQAPRELPSSYRARPRLYRLERPEFKGLLVSTYKRNREGNSITTVETLGLAREMRVPTHASRCRERNQVV